MIRVAHDQFTSKLEHEPLKNIAMLRHAKLFKELATYFTLNDGSDDLVVFEKSLSRSDVDDYPDAQTVTICRTGTCFEELKGSLPHGKHILKINGQILRQGLSETNRFISLTRRKMSSEPSSNIENATEVFASSESHFDLFSLAHWSKSEILAAKERGARLFALEHEGAPQAACILHNAYGDIWEIGALGTNPLKQNKGLAKALVSFVTNKILQENKIPRYHVNSKNERSLRVAKSCGYEPFMEFVHYEFEI